MSHYASLFRGIAHLAATAQDKGNMISALGKRGVTAPSSSDGDPHKGSGRH